MQWLPPLRPRSPDEPHRPATPLELFFDLVFVVAVAQAASGLHHFVADGHAADGVVRYAMVFFGIWWAWMNFTWFASAFDNDDVGYRLAVFVQLGGALILAAGISRAFDERDFAVATLGYVVMRLALVFQWLRAASGDPLRRPAALRYAVGVSLVQLAWILLLLVVPSGAYAVGFFTLAACELSVPIWAERHGATTWHPRHIAERYGLFTIIVLGESILAATIAIQSATLEFDLDAEMLGIIVGGFLIVLSMWWMYFDREASELLTSLRSAFIWGYGHLFIFASIAAVGAGIAVSVDQATGHAAIGARAAGAAVAIPVALFLICLWVLHYHPAPWQGRHVVLKPAVAALVLLTPFSGAPVLVSGLLLAALVAITVVFHRLPEAAESHERGTATPWQELGAFEVAVAEAEQPGGGQERAEGGQSE
jgi:low temperature requirement protein LtrA